MTKLTKLLTLTLGCSLFITTNAPLTVAAPVTKKKPAAGVVVQGKIKAIARTPRPGSVPYKDAVTAIHLIGVKPVKGKLAGSNILVYVWGMRANKLTPAAAYRPGQMVKLTLQPWEKVEGKYSRYQRMELDDDNVLTLNTYWGEPAR